MYVGLRILMHRSLRFRAKGHLGFRAFSKGFPESTITFVTSFTHYISEAV